MVERHDELFVGTTMPGHGDSSIGVDGCRTGDLATIARWPRVRTVLWDPNDGCSFFGDDNCDPFEDEDSLKPGYAPASVYLFEWGRLRPEPDEDIELLEKPYLNLPSPSSEGAKTSDSIFLYRATLPIASGAGTLADCGDWPTARGDVLLTRLRPDTFTRPGYTPPDGSQTTSPPIDFRASDMHPWDDNIMGDSMPVFSEPPDLAYDVPLGDNVSNHAASHAETSDQFIARLLMNPLNEPRRAPYSIIGQAFDLPLVVGTLHTVHADLCLLDGNTCQARPEGTSIPVYSVPVPDQPGDEVWVDLSTTWWEPLTLEEQGAQSGDAIGKDIPHPKGLLSSMKDSESLDQLKQRLRWNLVAAPVLTPDMLDDQEPGIETDPFQRVVPQARLNVTEPGVYEVEFAIEGDESDRLVMDKARFISLDIDAHWPGTMSEPGLPVNDAGENEPLNLFLAVNDNDDNFDKIVDNDSTDSPTINAEDRDIVTIIVRKFVPPSPADGTLEVTFSDGLRVFSADGSQEFTLPLSVALANPTGPLANVVNHDVMFRVEATQTADDAIITLVYTLPEQQTIRDEVHMTVLNPQVTGGFTRGSVRYSAAHDLPEEVKWAVCGELTVHHPHSILVSDPTDREKTKGNVSVRYGISTQLNDSGELDIPEPTTDAVQVSRQYFQWQAAIYNGIVVPLNAILKVLGRPLLDTYDEDTLAEGLSQETGIDVETLKSGKYFVIQNLYEPGFAVVQYLFDVREIARDYGYVFRLDLDIHHGDENATEVHDADEKTLGAITLANLNDTDDDSIPDNNDPEVSTGVLVKKGDPDLMKLVIRKIEPTYIAENIVGKVALHVKPGSANLWKNQSKKIESPQDKVTPEWSDEEGKEDIYTFSFAELENTLWVEATRPGHIKIDLEFLGAKDTVWATAHWGDLDIDSDNNNGTDRPPDWKRTEIEDRMENDPDRPGKLIMVNDGDQDNDGIPDFADTETLVEIPGTLVMKQTPLVLELPESFELSKAQVRFHYSAAPEVLPVNSPVYTPGDEGHLRMRAGSTKVHYIEPNVVYRASELGSGRIMTFFLEGIRPTTSPDDQRIVVEIDYNGDEGGENFVVADVVRVTVVRVDLDIDSDNENGFNIPLGVAYDEEDHFEDLQGDAARPGKFIVANMGDADEDNIPDFADAEIAAKDGNEPARFTPITLTLPEPLHLEQTRIRFVYSDSDPTDVHNPKDNAFYRPAPGHLRIWKKDAVQNGTIVRLMTPIDDGGHFVKADTAYKATDLGSERTLTFYVEGIDGSSGFGEQQILVEVAPNGDDEEQAFLCRDRIRTTVMSLEMTNIDFPNDGVSFTTRNEPPDHVENEISLTVDLKPNMFDAAYNAQIRWEIQDDPIVNREYLRTTGIGAFQREAMWRDLGGLYIRGESPALDEQYVASLEGTDVSVEFDIPKVPNGRGYPLNYRIRANVVVEGRPIYSHWQSLKQDEKDELRQQYFDMNYTHFPPPEREELVLTEEGNAEFIDKTAPAYWDNGIEKLVDDVTNEYQAAFLAKHPEEEYPDLQDVQVSFVIVSKEGSGFRSPIHNEEESNEKSTSRHAYGLAADCHFRDENDSGKRADEWYNLLEPILKTLKSNGTINYYYLNEEGVDRPDKSTDWFHVDMLPLNDGGQE